MQMLNIAGGGVAGLALGLALRREGVPVTVFEAGVYPRHRLCGEFISGAGPDEFAKLGLSGLFHDSERLADAAWFCGDELILHRPLPVPAAGISRWRLDAGMAARLTELGGDVRCGERVGELPGREGWVTATGRHRTSEGPWLAQKAHYRNLTLRAGLEMHLGRGGYAGIAKVEHDTANVCALLPASVGRLTSPAFPDRLRAIGLEALAERLEAAETVEGSRCGVSHFITGWQSGPAGALPLGDHCAIIPPFTGHGLSMALLGALEAAPRLAAWSAGTASWQQVVESINAALRRQFRSRLRWAAWLHPLLLRTGGQTSLRLLARSGLLPWQWLFQKVR